MASIASSLKPRVDLLTDEKLPDRMEESLAGMLPKPFASNMVERHVPQTPQGQGPPRPLAEDTLAEATEQVLADLAVLVHAIRLQGRISLPAYAMR